MTKYEKMRCFKCGSVNILFSYATGYECKDCGANSGDPEGFVYDFIYPVKEDQQATIAQLTAERDAWRADAERLAKNQISITKTNHFYCSYCGYLLEYAGGNLVHRDTCPLTLHRQLSAQYGTENPVSDADISG